MLSVVDVTNLQRRLVLKDSIKLIPDISKGYEKDVENSRSILKGKIKRLHYLMKLKYYNFVGTKDLIQVQKTLYQKFHICKLKINKHQNVCNVI